MPTGGGIKEHCRALRLGKGRSELLLQWQFFGVTAGQLGGGLAGQVEDDEPTGPTRPAGLISRGASERPLWSLFLEMKGDPKQESH